MDRKPVESALLSSIGYDLSSATIEVEFKKGGAIWQYFDVPEHVWNEFEFAASHGKYFLGNIKNQYKEARVG